MNDSHHNGAVPQAGNTANREPNSAVPNEGNDRPHSVNQSLPWAEDLPAAMHSQTVGERGPVLEQDNILHETLETFVHSKIIERPVHVKGFGAFGYFETVHSMTDYTMLSFLQTPGQQVPVAVRFSLAVSNKGTPDTSRNVRGFSTKFYTEQGVFDLLCNHIPVFFGSRCRPVPGIDQGLSPLAEKQSDRSRTLLELCSQGTGSYPFPRLALLGRGHGEESPPH